MVDISLAMQFKSYAQQEHFGTAQVLYILNGGLVGRKGDCSARVGWGVDFVLSDTRLAEPASCFTVTYLR